MAPSLRDLSPAPEDDRAACPRDASLALCLRFEGGFDDESPQRHRARTFLLSTAPGPTGQSGVFGPGSTLEFDEAAGLDVESFTIEAWVKPRSLPGFFQRAGIVDNNGQYGLFINTGGGLTCVSGGASVSINDAVKVGQWTSVACTLDRQQITLWLDGRKVAEAKGGAAPIDGGDGLAIGANNPAGDNFDGFIDNLRIWSHVRKPRQLCTAALDCR
jgi:hypothetical protein